MRDFSQPGRSTAHSADSMAATSSPQATLAAIDTLRQGGNAVDAAVVASAVLCVTEPHMTGIGGDCFALIGFPDGRVIGLNASGRAARAADADWLKRAALREIEPFTVHAVTVPGAIDGWARLLEAHGTMTLGDALAPATDLAERGVPVTPRVALDWSVEAERLAQDEGASRHLLLEGRAPGVGEIMRYPALARTLRLIAKEGRDAFYSGEIAQEIVSHLQARGGLLTLEDFAATRADWVEPISTRFRDAEILEIPPSGQGLTALVALNILARFDLGKFAAESAERRHLEAEAMKLAWVLRNRHIADPEQAEIPVERLLSDATADTLAARIDPDQALEDPALAVPMIGSDTVYLTTVDRNRLAVSFINSLYWSFGTGIVTPKSGIALQNRGSCFACDPDHPNCIGPGKRPLHTIIPAMVRRDGQIEMSFGVMGGSYQPMGHVAVAVNRYVYGMDPQEALDFPRHFPEAGELAVESSIPTGVIRELEDKGHRVVPSGQPLGGGQAIAIDRRLGTLVGGSDPRKDGCALGS